MHPHEVTKVKELPISLQVITLSIECFITFLHVLEHLFWINISEKANEWNLEETLLSVKYPGEETEKHIAIPVVNARKSAAYSSIIEIEPSEELGRIRRLTCHEFIIYQSLMILVNFCF